MNSLVGQRFGKYELQSLLGRGGFAAVYLAHDPQLDRRVAIKLMHPQLADEPGFAERFSREARAVARLRHPNIVQVHEFDLSEGRPYMVMEYVDGGTLKERLRAFQQAGQPMPPDDVVRIATAIGSAIDYAHQHGMVHRDIKPTNILFTQNDEPVLADFGIAKVTGQTLQTLSGSVSGTPAYMAPEQAQGNADTRSDEYSFAVVIYEMLTGRTPFSADTPVELMMKHATETPPSPLEWRPDLPPAVADVLRKALAKHPDERYQSVGELVGALQSALHGERVADEVQDAPTLREEPLAARTAPPLASAPAPSLRAASGAPPTPVVATAPPAAHQIRSIRARNPLRALAVLALAALVISAGVFVLMTGGGDQSAEAPATTPASVTGTLLLVADFKPCRTCDEIEYGRRIAERVKLEINRLALSNVAVRRASEIYPDSETARSSGLDQGATLVIWGAYDKAGVLPHVELLRAPQSARTHLVMPEELSAADFHLQGGDKEIAFVTLLALGLTRYADDDYASALSLYDAGLQALGAGADTGAPNAEIAYFYKALAQFANGEAWTVVEGNLKKAIALKPNWADAHYLLALATLSACKPDGSNAYDLALQESEAAVGLRADASTTWMRGFALQQLRRWSDAAKSYEQSLKLKEDAGVRAALSEAYRRSGRADLADQAAQKMPPVTRRSSGDQVEILRDEAEQWYARGNYADSALRYQQAISRAVELKRSDTAHAALALGLGSAQLAQQQFADALVSYQKSESLWGRNWPGYDSLALVFLKLGRNDEALAAFEHVVENTPCNYSAHLNLADLYAKQGRTDQALAEYQKATVADPGQGLAYVSMANLLAVQGKEEEATAALRRALNPLEEQVKQEPTNANIVFVLGAAYYQLEQYAPALAAFQKYAALAPDDPAAPDWLGSTLFALGRFADAIPELERANQRRPNSLPTVSRLADAYRMVNRLADAQATYAKVVALDPRDTDAWLRLAKTAEQQKDWAEAARAYDALLGLNPRDASLHASLAFAYWNQERVADAIRAYRAAVALEPNVAAYHANLAWALVVSAQVDEAMESARRALQVDSNTILAHYVLGLVFKAQGDKAQAIREFQAVAQSPSANAELRKAAEQELQQLK